MISPVCEPEPGLRLWQGVLPAALSAAPDATVTVTASPLLLQLGV